MVRTVIALPEREKRWLDRRAALEGVPMTELIRRAVVRLREQIDIEEEPFEELLKRTRGVWTGSDGLDYQVQLRDEW